MWMRYGCGVDDRLGSFQKGAAARGDGVNATKPLQQVLSMRAPSDCKIAKHEIRPI